MGAALLHKAADMDHVPTLKETKFLLPKPALSARDIKPPQWVNMVQGSWAEVQDQTASHAKAEVLRILSQWQLFGSSFFAVRRDSDPMEGSEHILALNKHGVHFLDMKCGNLMQQRISRIQTDQAVEIARLIKQYITIDQRARGMNTEKDPGLESRSGSRLEKYVL